MQFTLLYQLVLLFHGFILRNEDIAETLCAMNKALNNTLTTNWLASSPPSNNTWHPPTHASSNYLKSTTIQPTTTTTGRHHRRHEYAPPQCSSFRRKRSQRLDLQNQQTFCPPPIRT